MAKTTVQTIERKTSVPRSVFRDAFTGIFGKSSSHDAKASDNTGKKTATKSALAPKKAK